VYGALYTVRGLEQIESDVKEFQANLFTKE
jgi:hypothetical protein